MSPSPLMIAEWAVLYHHKDTKSTKIRIKIFVLFVSLWFSSARAGSSQELYQSAIELTGMLDLWNMTALVNDQELRACYLFVESLTTCKRRELVFTSPNDQGRLLDRREPVIEHIFTARECFKKSLNGVASICLYTSRVDSVHSQIACEDLLVVEEA